MKKLSLLSGRLIPLGMIAATLQLQAAPSTDLTNAEADLTVNSLPPGEIDLSFRPEILGSVAVYALAVQSNDKVVVGGAPSETSTTFSAAASCG